MGPLIVGVVWLVILGAVAITVFAMASAKASTLEQKPSCVGIGCFSIVLPVSFGMGLLAASSAQFPFNHGHLESPLSFIVYFTVIFAGGGLVATLVGRLLWKFINRP